MKKYLKILSSNIQSDLQPIPETIQADICGGTFTPKEQVALNEDTQRSGPSTTKSDSWPWQVSLRY